MSLYEELANSIEEDQMMPCVVPPIDVVPQIEAQPSSPVESETETSSQDFVRPVVAKSRISR